MSIFIDEPEVKGTEWHYNMMDMIWSDYDKPKTQCSYFWTVVWLVITFPFWAISAYYFGRMRNSRYDSEKLVNMYGTTFIGTIMFVMGMCFLGSILYLIGLLFDPTLLHEYILKDPSAGFTDDNFTPFGSFLMAFVAIDILAVFASSVYGLYKLAGYGVGVAVEKMKSIDVDEDTNGENGYTLLQSFFGWIKDRKNKVCKPINYPNKEK